MGEIDLTDRFGAEPILSTRFLNRSLAQPIGAHRFRIGSETDLVQAGTDWQPMYTDRSPALKLFGPLVGTDWLSTPIGPNFLGRTDRFRHLDDSVGSAHANRFPHAPTRYPVRSVRCPAQIGTAHANRFQVAIEKSARPTKQTNRSVTYRFESGTDLSGCAIDGFGGRATRWEL